VFSVLRDGNLTLIDKLAPVCTRTTVREPGAPVVEIQYSCVAYNGDTGFGLQVCRRNGCTAPINEAAVHGQGGFAHALTSARGGRGWWERWSRAHHPSPAQYGLP
jgi:hypothetical protein